MMRRKEIRKTTERLNRERERDEEWTREMSEGWREIRERRSGRNRDKERQKWEVCKGKKEKER